MKTVSYKGTPVYRASDDPRGRKLYDTSRGINAITNGVYFGLTVDAVKGYGKYLHAYRVDAPKVASVRGDAELDEIKREAIRWGENKINEIEKDETVKMTRELMRYMSQLQSRSEVTRMFLEEQGFQGIEYLHSSTQDHHDQFILFRKENVKRIESLDESKELLSFKDFIN